MYKFVSSTNVCRITLNGGRHYFSNSTGDVEFEEYKIWLSAGNTPLPADLLSQSEQFSAIEQAFDKHIDDVASAHGYGRVGLSPSAACLGYAAYQNQWQAEAIKYGQWVANCCAILIQGQQDVIAGTRTIPTPEQAISELPIMVW